MKIFSSKSAKCFNCFTRNTRIRQQTRTGDEEQGIVHRDNETKRGARS